MNKCINCGKEIKVRNMCASCKGKENRNKMSNSICNIESCSNVVYAKKLCRRHYRDYVAKVRGIYCSKCDKPVHAKGLCFTHYQRKYVYRIDI